MNCIQLTPIERQNTRLYVIYSILNECVVPLRELTPYMIAVYGRVVGNEIYELPPIYSGYASKQALIEKYLNKTEWTKEHMWPRQMAGEALVQFVWNQSKHKKYTICVDEMIDDLKDLTVVNYTTKNENMLLKPYQRKDSWVSPEYAYEMAKIELLPWPPKTLINKLPQIHPELVKEISEMPQK